MEEGKYLETDRGTPQGGILSPTFDFLGFTHYCDKTRTGGFKVGRKTSSKKFRQKMTEMNQWLKGVRNRVELKVWWQLLKLKQKLVGHYQYYGLSGNIKGLQSYYLLSYSETGFKVDKQAEPEEEL